MQPGNATAQNVAQLVFELARAIRARRVHPVAHPVVAEAKRRFESAWRSLYASTREFTLEVGGAGLVLEGGAAVAGAVAAELAGELRARGVSRLRFHAAPDPEALSGLVEALAREPDGAAGFSALSEQLSNTRSIDVVYQVAARAGSGAADAERNAFLTQHIAELVRRLSELESCDDVSSYNQTANRIETCVDALLREKRGMDAYRAALVFARHATDHSRRSDMIRREAGERLNRLALRDELLDAVIEQACGAPGLASVQASQVLIAIGAHAVPSLIRDLEKRDHGSRTRVTQLLIALGDAAIASVIDELASHEADRARRAARILGEMQNPKAVPFLNDALRLSDAGLAREAAQALARIGEEAAIQGLISGLDLADEIALACAGFLGGLRHPAAIRGLFAVVDVRANRSERLCRAAIQSLGRIGGTGALAGLKRVLDHAPLFGAARFRGLRVAAAQAIGQIGGPAADLALRAHARRGDSAVRETCQEALRRLETPQRREK